MLEALLLTTKLSKFRIIKSVTRFQGVRIWLGRFELKRSGAPRGERKAWNCNQIDDLQEFLNFTLRAVELRGPAVIVSTGP